MYRKRFRFSPDPYQKGVLLFCVSALLILCFQMILNGFGHPIPCIIRYFTGLYCGGCGATRMAFALLHGNFSTAFQENQILFLLLPLWLCIGILVFIGKPAKIRSPLFLKNLFLFSIIILFLFGILRNFTFFSALRPL